jgi:hypothetical protein
MKTLALLFYKNKAARPPVGPGECLHKIKSHPGGFAPKGPFFLCLTNVSPCSSFFSCLLACIKKKKAGCKAFKKEKKKAKNKNPTGHAYTLKYWEL